MASPSAAAETSATPTKTRWADIDDDDELPPLANLSLGTLAPAATAAAPAPADKAAPAAAPADKPAPAPTTDAAASSSSTSSSTSTPATTASGKPEHRHLGPGMQQRQWLYRVLLSRHSSTLFCCARCASPAATVVISANRSRDLGGRDHGALERPQLTTLLSQELPRAQPVRERASKRASTMPRRSRSTHRPPKLLQGVVDMGFKKPSSIQERALPLILGGAYVARVPGACSPPVPFSRSFACSWRTRPHTPTDHRTSLAKHNRAPARRRLSAWACWASSIPTCTTRKRCVLRLLASLPFRFATSSSDWLASPISTLRSLSRKLLVRCAQTPRTHALNRERERERYSYKAALPLACSSRCHQVSSDHRHSRCRESVVFKEGCQAGQDQSLSSTHSTLVLVLLLLLCLAHADCFARVSACVASFASLCSTRPTTWWCRSSNFVRT